MKKLIVAGFIALFVATGLLSAPRAHAIDLFSSCTSNVSSQCTIVKDNRLDYTGKNAIWGIIQFVLGILGAVAVVMIVIGGIKFATSGGDAAGVSSAKKTILYSVIGLVVALLASGIVLLVNNYFG